MAYGKNTNWENEKKYLDNLSKNGNAGQKAWAENQKKELASAQSKYSGSSGGGTSSTTSTPTSNISSGGSSGGGSKSGGSSYSQYTAPTLGNTWDANTDYQAIINSAVENGDYVTAAKAEQLRNQKITATGSNYAATNLYKGWLDNTDYSTLIRNGFENGMSANEAEELYNGRLKKANGTIGLEQYADDDLMKYLENYINQQRAIEMQKQWEQDYMEDNPKEDYQSKYDPQIDAILNEILNREDFSYDAMNDPLYQQYAKMYQREGDRAMKETLAEAAAGAGGMNTYAITAAQQANNYYNSQLNDRIPELYQLAYDMYLNDKESKVQDLGILQNMDATQYNRYRDTINDWYKDKNFAYNAYQDAVQQGNWQTNFNYNSMLDNRNWNNDSYWANKKYADNRADIEYERNQAEQEEAQAMIDWLIKNGVTTIDAETIKKAGLDQNSVNQMIANYQQQQALKGTSSGGGSGSGKGSGSGYTGKVTEDDDTGYTGGNENYTKVVNACEQMASSGDKWGAAALAKESLDKGYITKDQYNELLAKYNPILDVTLGKYDPNYTFSILK